MRRFNPAMNAQVLQKETVGYGEDTMTVSGTIQKSGILFGLLVAGAVISWNQILAHGDMSIAFAQRYMMISAIAGFGIAMATIFLKKYAAFLAPLYAIVEGFFLGSISLFMERYFPGVVLQAVMGTFAVFAVMLALYAGKVIRVTDKLRSIVMVATGAIALMYLVNLGLAFFGTQIPFLHSSSPLGIGISILIIGVAAFNLLLDFDMIEQYAGRVQKHMEWYCGFGLLVTLVWLYLEILRLLARTRD
ncbi:MAG: Bax inhibitor-1/YccA family protein [Bdellovibrionales bacterium]|nr:Bax inhibitor-1/YccA family protein [Bdellovibrionales bacterium]